ncbi:MAG: isovaleryl-CoA dehydrogenase [Candidatus Dormibacteraeota bacterium]|nr:isovaleryl-CoA dehydrogenase [Candidatus Dormibacteraeota bacterium]
METRAGDQVLNQPPPLSDYDVFDQDAPLRDSVEREGGGWAADLLHRLGWLAGTQDAIDWGFQANANPPQLRTHDRFGHRLDEVEFHPAWHRLMQVAVAHGLHSLPWRERRPGAHVARAAAFYIWYQVESGHHCPVSMTFGAVPVLRMQPELAARWEPLATSLDYDPGLRPLAAKRGVLLGVAMTEKQGGSDVLANTTEAKAIRQPGPGSEYLLTGHKWFCSAPMSDAFLMLAQAPGGLSCFLVPRVLDDGRRNRILIQRLKDKLGNRSNASAEIELDGAWGVMVGEEGRGLPIIFEMVNHNRLDCVVGSAALMRQAVAQAIHHCRHRWAFGQLLRDHPLMEEVLADLAVESEATTLFMIRLAAAFDRADDDSERAFRRVGLALGKYWVCKRAVAVTAEAMECHGGNGYIEESILPRLYREAPLNSIWEGSGNINALDVLRAIRQEPRSTDAFLAEVERARGANARFDQAVVALRGALADPIDSQARARRVAGQMALVLEGSLLLRHGHPDVAEAFCASRLGGERGYEFGTLPPGLPLGAIVDRHCPTVADP